MIRSALALVLTASMATPAFAQTAGEKARGLLNDIKTKITAYDEGTGVFLANTGTEVTKWSLLVFGAAAITTAAPKRLAAGTAKAARAAATSETAAKTAVKNPRLFNRIFNRHFFTDTPYNLGQLARTENLSNKILAYGAIPVAVGVGLVGLSAIVFASEWIYYGTVGHPDQTANNQEFARFLALPVEQQLPIALSNPDLVDHLEHINQSIELVK